MTFISHFIGNPSTAEDYFTIDRVTGVVTVIRPLKSVDESVAAITLFIEVCIQLIFIVIHETMICSLTIIWWRCFMFIAASSVNIFTM